MKRSFIFCLILALISGKAYTTPSDSTTIAAINALGIDHYWGYLQYHYPEMAVLKQNPAQGLKLSYVTRGNGSKYWHNAFRNPKIGLSYMLMDLGHRKALGIAHTLSPFIAIPLVDNRNRLYADFKTSAGLAYMPKVYNSEYNNLNTAISTHLNVYIDLGLRLTYQFSNKINLNAGLHIAHFSNGSIKKPNYGLNYTLLAVGLQYGNLKSDVKKAGNFTYQNEKHRFLLTTAGSMKEAIGIGNPSYWVVTGSFEYSHHIFWPLLRAGISFDFMHDHSQGIVLSTNSIIYSNNWELTKLGIAATTEVMLDRLSLILHFGGYYYNLSSDTKNQWVYQRVGLRYRFTNRIWAHLALKTHWNIADYIEFGIAVKVGQ